MIKLQAASCPQCGASIEVNEQLEKTICQFCGTTILVSDAVEKYKVELSGTVKVDGIKNRDDHLSQAEKHFKVEEYNEARNCLKNIISEDTFDIDAYTMLVKCDILMVKNNNYNPYCSSRNNRYNKLYQECFNETMEVYERLQKIDENKTYESALADFKEDIDNFYKIKDDIAKGKKLADDFCAYIKLHYDYLKSSKIFFDYLGVLQDCFDWKYRNETIMHGVYSDRKDSYGINKVTDLTFDGILSATYNLKYMDTAYDENLLAIEMNLQGVDGIRSYEDLEKAYNLYMEKGKPMYEKEVKKFNRHELILNIFRLIGYAIGLFIILKLLRIF